MEQLSVLQRGAAAAGSWGCRDAQMVGAGGWREDSPSRLWASRLPPSPNSQIYL